MPHMSTTQQATVADALTTTSSYWFLALSNVTAKGDHGSPLSEQSNSIHTLTGENYQPFSLGACLPDSIRNDTGTRPLALHLLALANDPATANVNITLENGHVRKAIVLHWPISSRHHEQPGKFFAISTTVGRTTTTSIQWQLYRSDHHVTTACVKFDLTTGHCTVQSCRWVGYKNVADATI